MSPIPANTFRVGMRRGLIEYRNVLQAPSDIGFYVFGALAVVAVLWIFREATLDGTDFPFVLFLLPGILAQQIFLSAGYGIATVLSTEREDGTLLRSKALPHGVAAYVVGLVVRGVLEVGLSLVIVLVPAAIFVPGVADAGAAGLFAAAGFALLGVLAALPIGIVIGSLFRNPRAVGGLGLLVMLAFIVLSGLFYPIAYFPSWLQILAQIFPLYWLGLGLRGALLPDAMVVVEIGESWRVLETVGVLGGWAILGLVLAPALLRRMARRESGSAVEQRRQAALQRV